MVEFDLTKVAAITLVAHLLFAAGIAVHARSTGRDAGNWPRLTLLFGVVGVLGYAVGVFGDAVDD
ncbi:MAG: hypothetical protein ACQETB_01330 [Halobacteriota archaeon]